MWLPKDVCDSMVSGGEITLNEGKRATKKAASNLSNASSALTLFINSVRKAHIPPSIKRRILNYKKVEVKRSGIVEVYFSTPIHPKSQIEERKLHVIIPYSKKSPYLATPIKNEKGDIVGYKLKPLSEKRMAKIRENIYKKLLGDLTIDPKNYRVKITPDGEFEVTVRANALSEKDATKVATRMFGVSSKNIRVDEESIPNTGGIKIPGFLSGYLVTVKGDVATNLALFKFLSMGKATIVLKGQDGYPVKYRLEKDKYGKYWLVTDDFIGSEALGVPKKFRVGDMWNIGNALANLKRKSRYVKSLSILVKNRGKKLEYALNTRRQGSSISYKFKRKLPVGWVSIRVYAPPIILPPEGKEYKEVKQKWEEIEKRYGVKVYIKFNKDKKSNHWSYNLKIEGKKVKPNSPLAKELVSLRKLLDKVTDDANKFEEEMEIYGIPL